MATVRVYHSYYGCETGCCGHRIVVSDYPDGLERERFEFDHPDTVGSAMMLAQEVIKERWPECLPTIDWGTFEFETEAC